MEGAVDSSRTYGKSIDPGQDGRLEIKTPKGAGLKITGRGLELDGDVVGDKNLAKMVPIDDLASGATAGNLVVAVNALLKALRDSKRMRII
jgi:hypothetical protein